MGLFRRKQDKDDGDDWNRALESTPQPIDPADVDLSAAEVVVAALVDAIGSDAKMRANLPRLVIASGAPDPDNGPLQYMALREDPHLPRKCGAGCWRLACEPMKKAASRSQRGQ